MGFYQPFTIIKDAQRHGLKVLPVDVTRSNWECTLERNAQGAVDSGQKDRCQVSDVRCQNESSDVRVPSDRRPLTTDHCLRLGLLCVKGLREEAGRSIVQARSEKPFMSLDDLHRRVPELRKDELRKLAAVGALNFIGAGSAGILPASKRWQAGRLRTHRRDALWQVERVSRDPGPLYEKLEENSGSPLTPMSFSNNRFSSSLTNPNSDST